MGNDASRTQRRLSLALIGQLVRKDLKVKYQGSSLGFFWSLANPLLQLIIYSVVFAVFMRSSVPAFGFFLMSGLLVWNFFSMSVTGSSISILANAGLVKKVPFPHASLPLAAIGFAAIQVLLQLGVFILVLVVAGRAPLRPELLLLVPATIVPPGWARGSPRSRAPAASRAFRTLSPAAAPRTIRSPWRDLPPAWEREWCPRDKPARAEHH